MELLVSCTSYTFITVLINFFSEISQGATEGGDEQKNEENDAYLAHELANQQDEEPMEQEDDLPIAADDDSMADQADEPDSDKNEENALEQQDHDDDASMQGKTCLLHEITIIQPYTGRKCYYVKRLVCRHLGISSQTIMHYIQFLSVCRYIRVRCRKVRRICKSRRKWWRRRRRCYNHYYTGSCRRRRCSYIG